MENSRHYINVLLVSLAFVIQYFIFNLPIFLLLSVVITIIALISEKAAIFISTYWQKLGFFIGELISIVLLGFIFFLILTPIAILYRFFNKDPLHLRNMKLNTYFHARNHKYGTKDLENPW